MCEPSRDGGDERSSTGVGGDGGVAGSEGVVMEVRAGIVVMVDDGGVKNRQKV